MHLVLSLVYAAVLAKVIRNLSLAASLFVGGAFGLILYGVNLYAFTAIFRGSFRFVARSHSWPIWYSGSRQRPTAAQAAGRQSTFLRWSFAPDPWNKHARCIV